MDDLVIYLLGFLQIYLMIKLPTWLGVIKEETYAERYRFISKILRSCEDKNGKGGKTNRGKYYINEIPKGMSDDELIMNDVIDFEQAFK